MARRTKIGVTKNANGITIFEEFRVIDIIHVDDDIMEVFVRHQIGNKAGIIGETSLLPNDIIMVKTKFRRSFLQVILDALNKVDEDDNKFSDTTIAKCLKCKFIDTCDKAKDVYARNSNTDF